MEELSSFYIIYPLGLADFGLIELKEKWTIHFPTSNLEILSVDEGGILIQAKTIEGFALNHILRSPTRILIRFAEFKAKDFPKLYNKVSKLPWKSFMIGATPEVEASATNSKLFDSRKIEKAVKDGILEQYRKQPVKKKYLDHFEAHKSAENLPKIYYRAVDDIITLSIDTTGELLHKRGEKIFTGLAPIRESLASLLLTALSKNIADQPFTLIDPMSGSGTFLIEAHDAYKVNFDRTFSYQHFPLWIDYAFKNKFIESLISKENSKFIKFLGFEINDDVIKLAHKNVQGKNITIKKADLFDSKDAISGENLVIINPPYGIRVGDQSVINADFYKKIITKIRELYHPKRLGIIIPDEHNFGLPGQELVARIPFKNGGLPVTFFILK